MLSLECGREGFAELMKANGCVLTGIENSPRVAEEMDAHGEEVIVVDLESCSLADVLPGRQFDVVVFGEVLERLGDPGRLLDEARALLGPQGLVVLSIPSVAQNLRLCELETEVSEVHGLLRTREDALLALIEQRAALELESDERIVQLDHDLDTAIERQAELARTAEHIAQLEQDAERLSADLESADERFSALEQDYHELLGDFETHVAKELEEMRREGHQVHELTKAIQRSPFWSLKLAVRRLYRFGRD